MDCNRYGLHSPIGQSGNKDNREARMLRVAFVRLGRIGSANRAWLEAQSGKRPQAVIRTAQSVTGSIHWPVSCALHQKSRNVTVCTKSSNLTVCSQNCLICVPPTSFASINEPKIICHVTICFEMNCFLAQYTWPCDIINWSRALTRYTIGPYKTGRILTILRRQKLSIGASESSPRDLAF